MLGEYNSSGCGYPDPIDGSEEFPCLNCEKDTEDFYEDFCCGECEAEYTECQEEERIKREKEDESSCN